MVTWLREVITATGTNAIGLAVAACLVNLYFSKLLVIGAVVPKVNQ